MAADSPVPTPDSLYSQCLHSSVNNLNYNVSSMENAQRLRYLPSAVLIDIYVTIADNTGPHNCMDLLFEQLSDLEIFERLLRFGPARQKLFRCLSALMDNNNNKALAAELQRKFTMRYQLTADCSTIDAAAPTATTMTNGFHREEEEDEDEDGPQHNHTVNGHCTPERLHYRLDDAEALRKADDLALADLTHDDWACVDIVSFGMRLGSFLTEAGCLSESTAILQCVAERLRCMKPQTTCTQIIRLDCLQRLLNAEASLCNFKWASRTCNEIEKELLATMDSHSIPKSLLANTYIQFSGLYFARSEYDDSYKWSVRAMQHLEDSTPVRIVVDVLRQASKSCVVKRDFQRANMLICQAVKRAQRTYGIKHQKYGDTLLDYGFFLLNVDSVHQSVDVYKDALFIKEAIFGTRSFHVAIAHEDLAYAYYVHDYSTGNFTCARNHVEKAVNIMEDLVPNDHLMLASARRVKALLLEEIALDKIAHGVNQEALLAQSEELHKFALRLSLEMFGETNVQTAKHYGNLGRLYQTMERFREAECMHQKAIKIKTLLLGPSDYEVGLSIGHLASLYNYQMQKYREAEELYLRSIDISIRLFGPSYSGLEYDYLGLCHVYETLCEFEKYLKYASILENWQGLRAQNNVRNTTYYPSTDEDHSLEDIKYQFFNKSVNAAE